MLQQNLLNTRVQGFSARPQAALEKMARPVEMACSMPLEPTFSGKTQDAGRKPSLFARLALLAGMLIPTAAAVIPAQAQQPAAPAKTEAIQKEADRAKGTRTAGDADIDETIHPFVNTASDLPLLNNKMQQPVVDLVRNPLLSPGARQELTTLLNRFNQSEAGQLAVVVIPDTHRTELNTLATELFNQMGIGKAGKNNGALFVVNAAAAREGRAHGKTFLMPGVAFDSKLGGEKAAMLIKKHALPHLQNKDYDAAVKDTVKAITTIMAADDVQAQKLLEGGQVEKKGLSREEVIVICVVVAVVLLLLIALIAASRNNRGGGGGGGGGFIFIPDFGGGSGGSGGGFGDVVSSVGDAIADFGGGIADGMGGGD